MLLKIGAPNYLGAFFQCFHFTVLIPVSDRRPEYVLTWANDFVSSVTPPLPCLYRSLVCFEERSVKCYWQSVSTKHSSCSCWNLFHVKFCKHAFSLVKIVKVLKSKKKTSDSNDVSTYMSSLSKLLDLEKSYRAPYCVKSTILLCELSVDVPPSVVSSSN